MGDEDRVVIREEGPVATDEVEKTRHLLQIGGHVRVVAPEVRVVELDVDQALDLRVRPVEPAGTSLPVVLVGGGETPVDRRDDDHHEGEDPAAGLGSGWSVGRPTRGHMPFSFLPRRVEARALWSAAAL